MKIKTLLLISAILVMSGNVKAEDTNYKKIAVGFIYPGISAKYYFSDKIGLELHNGLGNDVFLMGARGIYNFKQINRITFYAGLEGDYITFNRKYVQEGLGGAGEIFIGMEYPLTKKLALSMDMGPSFISVYNGEDSLVKKESMDVILNMAVYWYFK